MTDYDEAYLEYLKPWDYYCTKCHEPFDTDKKGRVRCPICNEHRYVRDFGDPEEYDNMVLGGGAFNWNKP